MLSSQSSTPGARASGRPANARPAVCTASELHVETARGSRREAATASMLRSPKPLKPIIPSETFIRRLLQHAHDSIHIVDQDGVSVFDSAGTEGGILGFPMTEVIGRNNADLLHEDDRPRALSALESIFRTGKGGPIEYRIRHKDGGWRIYETIGQRYID